MDKVQVMQKVEDVDGNIIWYNELPKAKRSPYLDCILEDFLLMKDTRDSFIQAGGNKTYTADDVHKHSVIVLLLAINNLIELHKGLNND